MYQSYKDVAEFRLIYINEAHAMDGRRPQQFAEEKGITEHDDYAERCSVAEMMNADYELTIPIIVDKLDDSVRKAYDAWPDRLYIIDVEGNIAIAGAHGPRGLKPAMKDAERWLGALTE